MVDLSKYQDRLSVKASMTSSQIRVEAARMPDGIDILVCSQTYEEKCAELRRRIEAYKRLEFPASLDIGTLTLDEYIARLEVLLHELESKR